MRTPQKRTLSSMAVNLLLDTSLLVGVLVLMAHDSTGQTIHEWVGVLFAVAVGAHLLLHWDWIVATAKRLFQKISLQVRLKSLINLAIFVNMAIMIVSGLLISEVILAPLGLQVGSFWRNLHIASASAVVWLVGLHVAMSWKWILNAFRQHVGQPILHFVRRLIVRKPVAVQS